MKIISFVLDLIGAFLTIYGLYLNSNPLSQVREMFENGAMNPGNIYIGLGIVMIIIGIVMYFMDNKKEED